MSCLDLSVWKGIESVAYRLVCNQNDTVQSTCQNDAKLFADVSLSQRLLFEHEATRHELYSKDINKSTTSSNRKPTPTGLSAVHICNLWSSFQLPTLNAIYHHSAVRSRSGLIEKQSVVLYHFIVDCERYVSIHSEVTSLQLQEPEEQPGSEEKELQFIRGINDLSNKQYASKNKLSCFQRRKTLISLNCYQIFAESFRNLFRIDSFQRKSSKCPVDRAALFVMGRLEKKIASLFELMGYDTQIRSRQLRFSAFDSQYDQMIGMSVEVDFMELLLSKGREDSCSAFINRVFSSVSKCKAILGVDVHDWLAGLQSDDGSHHDTIIMSRRIQKIVFMACFYDKPAVIDSIYTVLFRLVIGSEELPSAAETLLSDDSSITKSSSLTMSLQSKLSLLDSTHMSDNNSIHALNSTPHQQEPFPPLLFRTVFNSSFSFYQSLEQDSSPHEVPLTLIELAISLGRSQVVLQLLNLGKHGNEYEQMNEVDVPIHLAIEAISHGRVSEVCCLALLRRAIQGQFTTNGERKGDIHSSFVSDNLSSFLFALEHQNKQGDLIISEETLLHLCCRRGYVLLVQYLLSLGASPMIPDKHSRSSLSCAIYAGHGKVTAILKSRCPLQVRRAVSIITYILRKGLMRRYSAKRRKMND